MGCIVVVAALAIGGCDAGAEPGGAAPSEPGPGSAIDPAGVKPWPVAPPAAEEGDPFSVHCTAGSGGIAVDIDGFTFGPRSIEVAAGRSITFTNRDATDHSVWSVERRDGVPAWRTAGSDPDFRLPEVLHQGDASTCTFAAPGTYRYLCGVHNAMTGSVTVT